MPSARTTMEPHQFPVFKQVSFKVRLRPGRKLNVGSKIEVQLPNSFTNDKVSPSFVKQWQTEDSHAPHFVRVCGKGGRARFDVEIVPREWVGGYKCATRHGRCVVATVSSGSVPAAGEVTVEFRSTTSPWLANQNPGGTDNEAAVFVRVNGKEVKPFPTFEVLPGPECYRRVIVPSSARPGEPFPVRLISLDRFSNLTRTTPRDVQIKLGRAVLAEGITYRGRGEVEVSLPEEGVFRLAADGVRSNPIRITQEPGGPYWGDIHIHNYPSVDAMGNTPYEYARDVSCLDFAGTAEHGAGGLRRHWAQTKRWCREHHEPGRFVTVLGVETNVRWHCNVYFYGDNAPRIPSQAKGGSGVTPEDLVKYVRQTGGICQIHHTGWGYDMRKRYPDEMRLLEIYSMHGSSELYCPGDPLALGTQRQRPRDDRKGPLYARDAWALGQRFVVHGSSDNHFGQGGVHYNSVTAVHAPELTRKSILDTMLAGRCYATTGERILLDFRVNGRPMGSEFQARKGEKLTFGIEVHGTDTLASVEVFACPFIEGDRSVPVDALMFDEDDPEVEKARRSWRTVFEATDLRGMDFSRTWSARYNGRKMVYYARIMQKRPITVPAPLEGVTKLQKRPPAAWSSPIWVLPQK